MKARFDVSLLCDDGAVMAASWRPHQRVYAANIWALGDSITDRERERILWIKHERERVRSSTERQQVTDARRSWPAQGCAIAGEPGVCVDETRGMQLYNYVEWCNEDCETMATYKHPSIKIKTFDYFFLNKWNINLVTVM